MIFKEKLNAIDTVYEKHLIILKTSFLWEFDRNLKGQMELTNFDSTINS